jgi:hypothetical protein
LNKSFILPLLFCDLTADGIHAYPIYDSGTGFKAEATKFFSNNKPLKNFFLRGFM